MMYALVGTTPSPVLPAISEDKPTEIEIHVLWVWQAG
jgi:hypothetical protein